MQNTPHPDNDVNGNSSSNLVTSGDQYGGSTDDVSGAVDGAELCQLFDLPKTELPMAGK